MNVISLGRIFSMHRLHVNNNPISGYVDVHTFHVKIVNLLHMVSELTCITLILFNSHRMIWCPNFGHINKYDNDCHTNDLDLTTTCKHDW
mgnify:CR=1 FL=1